MIEWSSSFAAGLTIRQMKKRKRARSFSSSSACEVRSLCNAWRASFCAWEGRDMVNVSWVMVLERPRDSCSRSVRPEPFVWSISGGFDGRSDAFVMSIVLNAT